MTTQNAGTNAADALEQAVALDGAGRFAAAQAAYLAVLRRVPDHEAALNQLGAMLCRTGHRSAARTAFQHAAACHPAQAAGHVNLANLLREDGALDAARRHYEAALAGVPGCAEAHQGLGNVFADLGEPVRAAWHRRVGWRDRVFTQWRYRGAGRPIRVLVLNAVAGGNIPVRAFLDDRIFAVTAVAAEYFDPAMRLPPHDVVLKAIGDAESCGAALHAAERLVSPARLINPPAAVRVSGRADNAKRLRQGPWVRTPRIVRLPRALVAEPGMLTGLGFTFPLLLRATGFHTGRHFIQVDGPAHLEAAAASMPTDDLLAIEALPARGADGLVRKYRVMIVGGRLYPLHLAMSRDWKVHYFTAGMADDPAFRAAERAFLSDMAGQIGPRACAALAWIAKALALDYAGVDFALDPDGALLLFEANATMALVPPPPDAVWDYRRPAFTAARDAAQALVAGP